MKNLIFALFSACILVFAVGCRKDEIIQEIEITPPAPVIVDYTDSKVFGRVQDRNGNFLEDATVKWGESQVQTDENGVFSLTGNVKERNAVLSISKEGYFESTQTLQAIPDETIRTIVQLSPRELTGTIQSNNGGSVSTAQGGKVEFSANSFIDVDGNPYNGEVNVYMQYLDPTIEDLNEVMPGNLSAINAENTPQILTSFGMMNVELEDNSGNPLQISQNAVLTTPVPASLAGSAPAEIPLWYFDTEEGVWREEGIATLQGNQYVGEVAHFTWWNCDIPTDFIYLEGQIIAGEENPVFEVKITRISDGTYGITWTSDKGFFAGNVPNDELLLIEVFSTCGELLHTQEVGPFSTDTELPLIDVTTSNVTWYNLSGTIVDCEGNGTEGYLALLSSNGNYSEIALSTASGNFSILLPACGDLNYSYFVVDLVNGMGSETASIIISEDTNLGVVGACDVEISESCTVIFENGSTEVWTPCIAEISGTDEFSVYTVSVSQLFENGTVTYRLTYIDWNNDPEDPLWAWSTEIIVIDSPDFVYDFELSQDFNLEIIQNAGVPGGLLHLIHSGIIMTNTSTSEVFSGVTFDMKATIQ